MSYDSDIYDELIRELVFFSRKKGVSLYQYDQLNAKSKKTNEDIIELSNLHESTDRYSMLLSSVEDKLLSYIYKLIEENFKMSIKLRELSGEINNLQKEIN